MLFAPSGKGRKRQKKGEKGRFRPISEKGGQTPLKPPFVTPPFAAVQRIGMWSAELQCEIRRWRVPRMAGPGRFPSESRANSE